MLGSMLLGGTDLMTYLNLVGVTFLQATGQALVICSYSWTLWLGGLGVTAGKGHASHTWYADWAYCNPARHCS